MTATPSNPNSPQNYTDESLAAELCSPLPVRRTWFNNGWSAIAFALTGIALLPLLAILIEILWRGLPQLKPEIFYALPVPEGVTGEANGFAQAIAGTLTMVGLASLISIPLGVITGIFLSEFGQSKIASAIRFVSTILSAVPSIIIGIFAYGVIVSTKLEFTLPILNIPIRTGGFSALAGAFALGVLMLPIVALTTEQALKLVPTSQRLASAALGGDRFQTTFRIVVASALPAILTGVLLAIARAAGETAPLLLTASFAQNWSDGLFSPTASLSVLIYNYIFLSADPERNKLAWTAALILGGFILFINIVSRLVTRRLIKR